jgi:hypothetical protein
LLVLADQGPQHLNSRDGGIDRMDVLDRLGRHLTERVAGDQRARFSLPRELSGNAHHRPPIKNDAQRSRSVGDDLALNVGQRYEMEDRPQLVARVHFGELNCLSDRRRVGVGLTVEMDHLDIGTPAREPPGCDGGVDPTRQQREHLSRYS